MKRICLPWSTTVLWREAERCTPHCPISACCWLPRGLVASSVAARIASGPKRGGETAAVMWRLLIIRVWVLVFLFLTSYWSPAHSRAKPARPGTWKRGSETGEPNWRLHGSRGGTDLSSWREILPSGFPIRSQVSTCAADTHGGKQLAKTQSRSVRELQRLADWQMFFFTVLELF